MDSKESKQSPNEAARKKLKLNKETLKGSDTVLVNTKLRLPNKPVATAAN